MIEVLSAGTLTTIQDWPGRVGHWEVGVPPSGPMDERSFRTANALVGNDPAAAGLEVTLSGPKLRFALASVVAVTGAPLPLTLDGEPVAQWAAVEVPAGGVLALGAIRGAGLRAYLGVRGGIDGEREMGSRAAFTLGRLGACGGRPLRRGDELAIAGDVLAAPAIEPATALAITNSWTLRVVNGPHGAPDFLTADGVEALWAATWTVHHHSDRSGVRLTGPLPAFAREDGGDAGLHPSNILDSAYGVGTIMLAGDMAVIVGPDGPSLGGFVAVGQVIGADLWRLGQVRPGDRVTLQVVRTEPAGSNGSRPARGGNPVLDTALDGPHGAVTYRRAGERALLVEFGAPDLDLRSRVRAHALHEALRAERLNGCNDMTPGVRSLHIQHDPDVLPTGRLLAALARLEPELPAPETLSIAARTVHLPLAWRHSEAMLAVERYATSVRADAPWCPDNIEFIRRINGLDDEDAVRAIVCAASYLVLGLGDVYLGAPVAVPLDPCHRLVTTKYSPARTWTPANAVGIGGAFLCVYGVEGPGGYQLVGRTVPIWHRGDDPPWRLRHFDQLRFHLVEEAELEELRRASDTGSWAPATEPVAFTLAEQDRLLAARAPQIAAFTRRRQIAFAAERDAWALDAAASGVGA